MTGNAEEKASRPPSGASSNGNSTDDTQAARKPSQEHARGAQDITKLDSKVLKVKDENDANDLYAHLPPNEVEILKRQVDLPVTKTNWATLYRFSTKNDVIIMIVSVICAIAGGAGQPLMTIVFGNLAGEFAGFYQGTLTRGRLDHLIVHDILYLIYIAVATFVTTYISTVGFIYTGEHISGKIRQRYLAACLRQNIGFFDKLGSGEITTRITADTNLIQDGLSEKVSITFFAMSTFVTAFVIGFIKSWKLTLILVSTVIAILFISASTGKSAVKYTKKSLGAYAVGGTVVEESISSIRNAVAFGTQEKLARQYDVHLTEAEKYGLKVKFAFGFMFGGLFLVIYWNYGLAFWMGSRFLVDGDLQLNDILTIILAIMIGAFSLGNVAPNVQAMTTAISAAGKVFNTIDRVSPLDPASDAGVIPEHVSGALELRNIKHIYPSRPEVTVMSDVSLTIPAGKMTALVGASGSGKSTVVGLVERFYDPVEGEVLLDGQNISTLNLRWLRRQVSLVSQEPTLFGTSIYNNIRHGLIGTKFDNGDVEKEKELIYNAAKMANAHDFITTLPEGYETNVGERGFLLSGGQKQRIAIARAMVSDPKILLLDEATSALDTKSEGVVQAALETAAEGRTTITIAHRLSTIRDADNIVVMAEGRIVEQGTHNDLLAQQGTYFNLVEAQNIAQTTEMSLEEEEVIDAHDEKLAHKASSHSMKYEKDPDDANIANKLNRSETEKSQSSLALKRKTSLTEQHDSLWTLIKLIASFNRPELVIMLFGLVFAVICGGGNPTQAVFFAKQIEYLSLPVTPATTHTIRHNVDFWSLMYLMLGLVMLLSFIAQGIAFAFSSERLIHRVRDRAFRTMLRQDIAFFDQEENTAGALTSFLSTETTHVAGLSGSTLGTILSVVSTLISAIALSIAIAWKLALVCTATVPLLLGCGFFRFWMLAQFQRRSKKVYEKSASYACEATSAIRTVASLTREDDVLQHYTDALNAQARQSLYSVAKSSILYAASQSLTFLVIALGFCKPLPSVFDVTC